MKKPSTMTTRRPLTDRQAECLAVIRGYWIEHGLPPTLLTISKLMGMEPNASAAKAHIRLMVRKGYLRGVQRNSKVKKRADYQTYVPTDAELVVQKKGGQVRIAMTGPGVEMTRDEWRKWLKEQLAEA